ncbi:chitobiase/beta-hexosaminidase C-terminal domain-containing protein, partial [Flintibacter sp. NSJ-23]|nr:chitobiase/beta-hexosaminidase C-terminal domain-containing protein [Flintibacter hominis]
MKRKILSSIMALVMIVSMLPFSVFAEEGDTWAESASTEWYTGDGDEYTISSAADLAGLAQLVNGGTSFQKKTIKLGENIDLEGKEWTPIGRNGKPFQGTFDGQGNTISNLKITGNSSDAGLFGFTTGGEIKDFTLNNAQVEGYLDVGAVAGTPHTSKYTNINVTGLIQIDGYSYVGGAFGKNAYANITNVDVTGGDGSYVKAESEEYRTYVGGLVGFMGEGNITISGCDVKIDVIGSTSDVGGLLGILHYGNTMTNCTYEGNLTITNPDSEVGDEFGALVGTAMNSAAGKTTISDCTATVNQALSGGRDVTDSITPHGDFYNDVTTNNAGTVDIQATVNDKEVTVDNSVAYVGDNKYVSLAEALEAVTAESDNKTVTITRSGTYEPFSIAVSGVTVQTADGVTATVKTDKDSKVAVTAADVTLKGLDFVSEDGTAVISGGACDGLTLDNCSFENKKDDLKDTIALYIHQPSITVQNCDFTNWERGYYTCGDNSAAGAITFEGNTFTNVRVPFDGYWGKPATEETDIQITGNTFDSGDWDAAYIQLWDYAQYQYWLDGENSKLNPEGKSALKATISGNTYKGNVVIYKTHCDWNTASAVTIEDTDVKVVNRNLIVLDGLTENDKVTVTKADGSPITAFNDFDTAVKKGEKYVIYSLSEGDYTFHVSQKADNSSDTIVTEIPVTVAPPKVGEVQEVEIVPIAEEEKFVAQVEGGEKYTSVKAAIDAVGEEGTVKLLRNVTLGDSLSVGKTMTLDLNGRTITAPEGSHILLVTANTFTLKDSSGSNAGKLTGGVGSNARGGGVTIQGGATFVMEGGTITGNNGSKKSAGGVHLIGNAKFIMNGGVITGNTSGTLRGGVYADMGSVQVSGTATILGNKGTDGGKGINSDLWLNTVSNVLLTIGEGGLSQDAKIGIYINSSPELSKEFTAPYESGRASVNNFVDNRAKYQIVEQDAEDGQKQLVMMLQKAAAPVASPAAGTYIGTQTVELSTTTLPEFSKIYYTLDGSDPTASDTSQEYTGALTISSSTTVKAYTKGLYKDSLDSDVAEFVYTINSAGGGGGGGSSSYSISVDKNIDNGSVTVSPRSASSGRTVTITVKPDEGYELDELTVTDKNGDEIKLTDKGDGKYTFKMPRSKVTIEASFVEIDHQDTCPSAGFR